MKRNEIVGNFPKTLAFFLCGETCVELKNSKDATFTENILCDVKSGISFRGYV